MEEQTQKVEEVQEEQPKQEEVQEPTLTLEDVDRQIAKDMEEVGKKVNEMLNF